ncbi:hypothetical protein PRIC1_009388 [Phytophthora ramorum]
MSGTASSSSSTHSRGRSASPAWSPTQSSQRCSRRSVVRTTEKSVVFRVRTQEQLSSGRGTSNGSSQHKTLYLTQSENTRGTDDAEVHEILTELYGEVERKKQWLSREEQTFQRGQDRLDSLQREHDALLRNLDQCERRRKERVRIQKMLRGPQAESEDYDSDVGGSSSESDCSSHKQHRRRSGSHHRRPRRDGAKKERKRLRRFQSDVSLRFQLLQSECQRSDLQVEKLMVDLRREYADSCLFGNSLNF